MDWVKKVFGQRGQAEPQDHGEWVAKWQAYRADPVGDGDAFCFLLNDATGPDYVEAVLGGLPGAEGMIARINHLISVTRGAGFGYRLPEGGAAALTPERAVELAVAQHRIYVGFLRDKGEVDLAQELEGLAPRLVEKEVLRAAMDDLSHPGIELYDALGDLCVGVPPEPKRLCYAVEEMVLHLTKYPDVTRYLLEPYWPSGFDEAKAFELYLGGYQSFAASDALMVAKMDG